MKAKQGWIISELVMLVLLGVMVVNWYVKPLPDWVVICIGVLLLVNVFILTYTFVRSQKKKSDHLNN